MRTPPARRLLPLLIAALALCPAAARAQGASQIGSFGDWEAYQELEGGKKVCYIGSKPKKSQGKYRKRGDVYMLITHRPAEKALDVVSINAGYTYQPASEADVQVGDNKFKLFTDGDYAFAYDQKADAALVAAMIKGAQLTVKGVSNRGTATTDTYSLKGFTAAHKAIGVACGVK